MNHFRNSQNSFIRSRSRMNIFIIFEGCSFVSCFKRHGVVSNCEILDNMKIENNLSIFLKFFYTKYEYNDPVFVRYALCKERDLPHNGEFVVNSYASLQVNNGNSHVLSTIFFKKKIITRYQTIGHYN